MGEHGRFKDEGIILWLSDDAARPRPIPGLSLGTVPRWRETIRPGGAPSVGAPPLAFPGGIRLPQRFLRQ